MNSSIKLLHTLYFILSFINDKIVELFEMKLNGIKDV